MIFLTFYNFWCGFHCCAHENEVYFMYVFLPTFGSPEIGFLNNFYCVLSSIHEYFREVLRTYLSTFIKWVLSTDSSINFSSYQYSVLTRVLIFSTHSMPGGGGGEGMTSWPTVYLWENWKWIRCVISRECKLKWQFWFYFEYGRFHGLWEFSCPLAHLNFIVFFQ